MEPSADPANILWAASRFAENDFTYLHHGQYLFRYPHQLPVTAFRELFLRLVGPDNPYWVQLLRLFNLAAALWAMYVLTRLYRQELAENDTFKKNDAVIVLFGAGVLFSTFIYGNIPSIALAIFGGFLFQLVWEGKSQYILQYFMLALPYGAAGLNEMAAALKTRILRLRSRQSKTAKAG